MIENSKDKTILEFINESDDDIDLKPLSSKKKQTKSKSIDLEEVKSISEIDIDGHDR